MELRHLRYFVAVAEERNFTRAAVRLCISQPPLSRQIRDLERELGINLFERTPQAVHLTRAGTVFLREAQAILRQADDAVQRVRSLPTSGRPSLYIGYAPVPTAQVVPRAMKLFRQAYPSAHVELMDQPTDANVSGVASGALDLSVLIQPPLDGHTDLEFIKLFDLPVGIIVPHDHALARRERISLRAAMDQTIIPYVRKGYEDYHEWFGHVIRQAGHKPRLAKAVDGPIDLFMAVQAGKGVGFASRVCAGVAGDRVKFVALTPEPPPLPIGYLVRRGRRLRIVEGFIEALHLAAQPGRVRSIHVRTEHGEEPAMPVLQAGA